MSSALSNNLRSLVISTTNRLFKPSAGSRTLSFPLNLSDPLLKIQSIPPKRFLSCFTKNSGPNNSLKPLETATKHHDSFNLVRYAPISRKFKELKLRTVPTFNSLETRLFNSSVSPKYNNYEERNYYQKPRIGCRRQIIFTLVFSATCFVGFGYLYAKGRKDELERTRIMGKDSWVSMIWGPAPKPVDPTLLMLEGPKYDLAVRRLRLLLGDDR
ncbi:hypothetical protein AYI68_g3342, partial [Smittium mucronatum]